MIRNDYSFSAVRLMFFETVVVTNNNQIFLAITENSLGWWPVFPQRCCDEFCFLMYCRRITISCERLLITILNLSTVLLPVVLTLTQLVLLLYEFTVSILCTSKQTKRVLWSISIHRYYPEPQTMNSTIETTILFTHYCFAITAISLNLLLLFCIFRHTPATFSTFGIMIKLHALSDLYTALGSSLSMQRWGSTNLCCFAGKYIRKQEIFQS